MQSFWKTIADVWLWTAGRASLDPLNAKTPEAPLPGPEEEPVQQMLTGKVDLQRL